MCLTSKTYSSFDVARGRGRLSKIYGKRDGGLKKKCFEIWMPQVFQDSQVAGNIYASCDTLIGLLFSAVIIYNENIQLDTFFFPYKNFTPLMSFF